MTKAVRYLVAMVMAVMTAFTSLGTASAAVKMGALAKPEAAVAQSQYSTLVYSQQTDKFLDITGNVKGGLESLLRKAKKGDVYFVVATTEKDFDKIQEVLKHENQKPKVVKEAGVMDEEDLAFACKALGTEDIYLTQFKFRVKSEGQKFGWKEAVGVAAAVGGIIAIFK